ncbi:hypothetical protein NQ317_007928 [Molorchus minor]|uniref:DDE Tnp4 domain-containing protein n=1 Tax=Molorchus minor TaxID=1323400 RepID=A0ABQ9JQG2_9CUCU|nr:hypothetical protein NQ317_007928 [Molorchus minor]
MKRRLENVEFRNSLLVADSGYANTKHVITPLLMPQNNIEQLYNESAVLHNIAIDHGEEEHPPDPEVNLGNIIYIEDFQMDPPDNQQFANARDILIEYFPRLVEDRQHTGDLLFLGMVDKYILHLQYLLHSYLTALSCKNREVNILNCKIMVLLTGPVVDELNFNSIAFQASSLSFHVVASVFLHSITDFKDDCNNDLNKGNYGCDGQYGTTIVPQALSLITFGKVLGTIQNGGKKTFQTSQLLQLVIYDSIEEEKA